MRGGWNNEILEPRRWAQPAACPGSLRRCTPKKEGAR